MKGRVIIVTGAASGVGAETAELLAREGACIILADINEAALHTFFKKIKSIHEYIVATHLDVRESASWEKLLKTGIAEFGTVDVVVNCAGVTYPGRVEDVTETLLRQQLDVNLLGAILGTQVLLKYFLREQRGHIIHIGSLGGLTPLPYEAAYTASKFGLRGFCLALDLELRNSPVRISIISPDSINTPMLAHEAQMNGSSLSFSGKILQPHDIAKTVFRVLQKPKREVLIPRHRGWLSKISCVWPGLLSFLYPVINKIGQHNLDRYTKTSGMKINHKGGVIK